MKPFKVCCKETSEAITNGLKASSLIDEIASRMTAKGKTFSIKFNRDNEGDIFRDFAEITFHDNEPSNGFLLAQVAAYREKLMEYAKIVNPIIPGTAKFTVCQNTVESPCSETRSGVVSFRLIDKERIDKLLTFALKKCEQQNDYTEIAELLFSDMIQPDTKDLATHITVANPVAPIK